MLIVSMRDRRLLRREHTGELVLHADGGQVLPDGIGLGTADHIWVSDPGAGGAVLIEEGGHVLQAVRTCSRASLSR